MNKHWFKLCNAVETDDEAEVLIYDEIGMWGVTAKDFVDELKASGAKKFHVRINSPGGDVFAGITIYNYLRSLKSNVRITVDGLAASIASVVAMAGQTVTMADNAMMMIHNPWGVVVGNSKDARELADVLDKLRDQIVKAYARTGQTAADIKTWMDEEKWMDAAQAVDLGFADEVDAGIEAQNFAAFNLTKFKHAPITAARDEHGQLVGYALHARRGVDIEALPNMKLDEALAKITTLEANVTALTTEKTALASGKADFEAQITAKDSEIGAFKTSITAKDGELTAAKDARTAAETALATAQAGLQAKVDEELAKIGQQRLKLPAGDVGTSNTMKRDAFAKLSPKAQNEFCQKGGSITD